MRRSRATAPLSRGGTCRISAGLSRGRNSGPARPSADRQRRPRRRITALEIGVSIFTNLCARHIRKRRPDSDACAEIRARSPCCRSTLPHPLRLKSFHYILSRLTTEKTGAPAPGWHRREREGAVCVRERPGCRTGRSLQLCAGPCRSGRTRAKGGRAEPSLSEPLWSGAQARE